MFRSGLKVLLDFAGCQKDWGAVFLFLLEEGVLGFSREGQMGLRDELQWEWMDLKQLSRRKRAFYFQGTPLLWRPKSSSAFCVVQGNNGVRSHSCFYSFYHSQWFQDGPSLQQLHSYQARQGLGKVRAGSTLTLFRGENGGQMSVLRGKSLETHVAAVAKKTL